MIGLRFCLDFKPIRFSGTFSGRTSKMADDLPEDFDVIVLGTGFPESVVAAALSRIGMKVLHLDRNDYYSDQWATFTFDSLLKWIDLNLNKDKPDAKGSEDEQEETGAMRKEAPSLESGTNSVPVPSCSDDIKNVVVKSYLCEKISLEDTVDVEAPMTSQSSTDVLKAAPSMSEPQNVYGEMGKFEDEKNMIEKVSKEEEVSTAETTLIEDVEEVAADSSSDKGGEQSHVAAKDSKSPADIENTAQELSEETSEEEVSDIVDSNGSLQSPFVPAQRVPSDRKPTIGVNMTYDDLKPYWRRFNIDISPKLLFSRGPLVEALISANISHYAEFKSVTRILTYMDGHVEEVPCSRADVFSSSVISIVEKRMLMKFLTFCLDYEQQQDQYEGFEDKPYSEFLQSRRLTPNLQHFIIHAIAMVKPETSTQEGLKATQRFLQSLGRYGNTPFIWPLYGAGELPQAFCRMCAVFGGLYCLRRGTSAITISEENRKCTGIISNNQLLKCKWLITGHSYIPECFRKECSQFVSRAVFITCSSVKPSDEEFITVLSMPPSSMEGEPVRVLELGHTSMACPKGLYVVHLISKTVLSAKEDLEPTAKKLFHFPSEGQEDAPIDKPIVLWSLYFNQAIPDSSCVTADLPSNVHVLSLPGVTIGFGEALQQAKAVFEKICPDEEFLQAVPNPEDIILDDFLQDGNNQNAEEPERGALADAGQTVSGEEVRPESGTEQELVEGDCEVGGRQSSEAGQEEAAVCVAEKQQSEEGTGTQPGEKGESQSSEVGRDEAPVGVAERQQSEEGTGTQSGERGGSQSSEAGQDEAAVGDAERQRSEEGEDLSSGTGQDQADGVDTHGQPNEGETGRSEGDCTSRVIEEKVND